MDRLLAEQPQRTDGRLTKTNLWKEAGVSRATMNRATAVMAEWDSRVTAAGSLSAREARVTHELKETRRQLAAQIRKCTDLTRQLDAAATAIAALHHDNTLLRQQHARNGSLADISQHRREQKQPEPSRS
ncbi:hypothetical protein DMH01_14710 [Amycolatopsis sp. WAC 04182]|nr:hypothetical protein DMH01_14710 [Amycolatopsis sp. WAC 04182]